MKVYIDILLLVNFFLDFLILIGVKILLKRKTSMIRIILASFFGEVTCIFLFLPLSNTTLLLLKLLVSILIINIAFTYKEIEYFKKNILYFYLLSIILGGIIYFLRITFISKKDIILNSLILFIIAPYLLYNYIKEQRMYKNNYTLRHTIKIYLDNKIHTYTAYLDTGNKLVDFYKRRPIILVNDDKLEFLYENSILVPFTTLDNQGIIKCRKPDKIVIDDRMIDKEVLIGQAKEKFNIEGIDVILPNIIREELE